MLRESGVNGLLKIVKSPMKASLHTNRAKIKLTRKSSLKALNQGRIQQTLSRNRAVACK